MKKIVMILSVLGIAAPVMAGAQEPLSRQRVKEAARVEQAAEKQMMTKETVGKEPAAPAKLEAKKMNVSHVQIDDNRAAGKLRKTDASVKQTKKFEPLKTEKLQMTPARKKSCK